MTNTQTQFTIYRDGQIDSDFLHTQRKQAAYSSYVAARMDVWRISRAFSRTLGEKLSLVTAPIYLDVVDAQNGSHLRKEWFERKRQERLNGIRKQFDLV